MRRAGAVIAALAALVGCGASTPHPTGPAKPAPPARPVATSTRAAEHVVVLVMENREEAQIIGNRDAPYETALARRWAVAADHHGIAHPSLPNYLALTSGSTQGITSDCTSCRAHGRNIVDQLEAAHRSWKSYMEGIPSPCFTGATHGRYAKKHNPLSYYDSVADNPARCRKVVGFGALDRDLRAHRLPNFAFISPDLCHDMHDCDVRTGDRFLAGLVPRILRAMGTHGTLILTWDEGKSGATCCGDEAVGGHIPLIAAGPDVRRGARVTKATDHYAVLRRAEDVLGLPRLGGARLARTASLDGLFRR